MQHTSNYMNVAVWIFRNDGQFYIKAQTQTSQTNRSKTDPIKWPMCFKSSNKPDVCFGSSSGCHIYFTVNRESRISSVLLSSMYFKTTTVMWPMDLLFSPHYEAEVFFFRIVTERKSLSLFRSLLRLVFILDHYFPWGGAGRGFIVLLTVNKQYILHIFQLQTQKRAPLSCGRSRRSCLRLWGRWRNETH